MGFISGREGKDNGIRRLLVLHKTRGEKSLALFLSVDAKKAIERVDWGFMMDTIENLGIGP